MIRFTEKLHETVYDLWQQSMKHPFIIELKINNLQNN
jgi:thiaminase